VGVAGSLTPVSRRRLHESVSEQLLRAIQAGEFPVDTRLPSERELSLVFGVTRPVVREALQSLERLGILRIAQGERAIVLRVTPDAIVAKFTESVRTLIATDTDAFDYFKEARLLFECGIARLAAERAQPLGLQAVKAALDAQRLAISRRTEFVSLDGEFHATVDALAGNPLFPAVSRGIFNWLSEHHVSSVHVPGREQVTIEEHEAILACLERGDADGAEGAVRRHLTRAADLQRAPTPPCVNKHEQSPAQAGSKGRKHEQPKRALQQPPA
jgi:GntR family transcriptional regulator, sialic acid-inducible nan operon repressor